MGSVKIQNTDAMSTNVCAIAKPFTDSNCRLCGANYEEETNNNNRVVVDSDTETTHEGSSASWEEGWPAQKTFLETPGMPSYIAKDANSLTFQWEAVPFRGEEPLTYQVEMQAVEVHPGSATPNSHTARNLVEEEDWQMVYSGRECWTQVKSLHPGGYYAVRIRCMVDAEAISDYSAVTVLHTTPTVPSEPQPAEMVDVSCDAMRLEWCEPWENGGSEITGFRLQLRPPPGGVPTTDVFELTWCPGQQTGHSRDLFEIEVENVEQKFCQLECIGEATQVEIEGLDCGHEYRFRVRGENEMGKGPWSAPWSLCLAPCAPGPPSCPLITTATAQSISCFWYPPQFLGGKAEIEYQVEVMSIASTPIEDGILIWKVAYQGTARECVCEDLVSGSQYSIRVKAKNEAGWGPPSWPVNFETPPSVPQKPLVPHAVERNHRSLRIYWIAPAHDGGREISSYKMQMCPADQLASLDNMVEPFLDVYEGIRKAVTLSDLTPGTVYAIRVCAVNEIGTSEWSDIGYESTPPGPPLPPQKLTVSQTPRSLHLQWECPESSGGAAVTQYTVAISKEDQSEFREVYNDTVLQCSVTHLEPSTSYFIKTKAENVHGGSDWSAPMMVKTSANLPTAPGHLKVSGATRTTTHLTWRPVSAEGVWYSLEMSSAEQEWVEKYRGNVSHCVLEELEAGSEYWVRVRAVNADGKGPYSETLQLTLDSDPPSIPAAPCTTQITASTIRIKWSCPEANGSTILHYRVKIEGTDGTLYETQVPSSKLFLKIGELTPETQYTMQLAAVNRKGSSSWSESVSATTKAAPPCTPQELRVLEISSQSLTLDWKMPEEVEGLCFEVEAFLTSAKKIKNLQTPTLRSSVSTRTCVWTGLEPNQKYEIRIRATSASGGSSKWSDFLLVRLPEEPLSEVKPSQELVSCEETEGISAARRVRKGRIVVPPKSRTPLKKRKSVWKTLRSYTSLLILVISLIVFPVLFLNQ